MAKSSDKSLRAQFKLALVLLFYPGLAWLLTNTSREQPLVMPVNIASYVVAAISMFFMAAVPVWAARYRQRPHELNLAFRRGLRISKVLIAAILPVEGVLVALGLYITDPEELWFWGIFTTIGCIAATLVLLESGPQKQPGVYVTLRALAIQLENHPRLEEVLLELQEVLGVPLPLHILVGLQPELIWTTGTVFTPGGELTGGVLCVSLPASSILSIPEFRALAGEAMLGLAASRTDDRDEFVSTSEAAKDFLAGLDDSMRQWRPKLILHPFVLLLWLAFIATMRFPLYAGKEWLTYYVKEFWISRRLLDAKHSVEAHFSSADNVGTVQVITARIKEAAIGLGYSYRLHAENAPLHALGEVTKRLAQEHPALKIERRASWYGDPVTAWQYLQFRCTLSGVNLEWCLQLAAEVSPDPPAASLFQNRPELDAKVLELATRPFV